MHAFVDISEQPISVPDLWNTLIVPGEDIAEEIRRLSSKPLSESGWRVTSILHPRAEPHIGGFAPGIDVRLCVVNPGETTSPRRHNAACAGIVISGTGETQVADRVIRLARHDIWNIPGMAPYQFTNSGVEPLAMLLYSNRPLLDRLHAFVEEADVIMPPTGVVGTNRTREENGPRAKDAVPPVVIGEDGATLLQYEHLIDPDHLPSLPLHWPYSETSKQFPFNQSLNADYAGRRLFLLYNPATEKRLGITHSLFATLSAEPPMMVHKPHRHVSAAINYIIDGSGWSKVGDQRVKWKAGDLHFSAPGWAVHNHASSERGYVILTIQDHPLHLANDSLVWQENMETDVRVLGSEPGFQTNITDFVHSE